MSTLELVFWSVIESAFCDLDAIAAMRSRNGHLKSYAVRTHGYIVYTDNMQESIRLSLMDESDFHEWLMSAMLSGDGDYFEMDDTPPAPYIAQGGKPKFAGKFTEAPAPLFKWAGIAV